MDKIDVRKEIKRRQREENIKYIIVWLVLALVLWVAIVLFTDKLNCMNKNVSELDWYCLYLLSK